MNKQFVVVVKFEVHAEFKAVFLERVRRQAQDSLELEAGCLVFDVCESLELVHSILLYEVYGCAEDFNLHLASKHFLAFDSEVRPWVVAKDVSSFERLVKT